jgi:hypothetical protein
VLTADSDNYHEERAALDAREANAAALSGNVFAYQRG